MQAYDKTSTFHNSMWHDATLKNVWYMPDARAFLFSVKAPAQNGYSTTLNEKEVISRKSKPIFYVQ